MTQGSAPPARIPPPRHPMNEASAAPSPDGSEVRPCLAAGLLLWLDPVSRPGPEAMAVDEWLLETRDQPVLRVYPWQGAWGSIGYFGDLADAREQFPDLDWVRRFTGGGTVDHRADWTYTLVIPRSEKIATAKGAESYRIIHAALARALGSGRLSDGAHSTGSTACFTNPVAHDIVNTIGHKLAGAGQRRTKHGLLHQGSVAGKCSDRESRQRAIRLAGELSTSWSFAELEPPLELVDHLAARRYGNPVWTERRATPPVSR